MGLKVLLALAVIGALGQPSRQSKIVEAGVYEHFTDKGGSWLGLYKSANGYAIKPCTVTLAPATTDDGKGTRVTTAPPNPLVAVKNPSPLKVGAVQTVFDGINGSLSDYGDHQTITLGKRTYALSVERTTKDGFRRCFIAVVSGAVRQNLPEVPARDAQELRWAGDLDGDGKLDLYLAISHHNYAEERYLYLSTMAKPKQLFGVLGDLTERKFE